MYVRCGTEQRADLMHDVRTVLYMCVSVLGRMRCFFGEESPYRVTVATATLYVPVTAVEQGLLILNLIYT